MRYTNNHIKRSVFSILIHKQMSDSPFSLLALLAVAATSASKVGSRSEPYMNVYTCNFNIRKYCCETV